MTLIRLIKNSLKKSLLGQGFTLIEIMVAALLLLFAMAGIVPLFLGGLSQASTVRYKSIATNVARERMEEIRQLDYREIVSPTSLTQLFGSTTTQRGVAFTVTYGVEESAYETGTLKKVTVNVGWNAPPKLSTASITTLIHQQFLGPRGALLEITPTSPDPLGTPFPAMTGSRPAPRPTKARYHLAEADWGLVFDNLDQPGMAARDVYMRLVFFDDDGTSGEDFKIGTSYLRYSTDADGKVNDIWFEYDFDASTIPDGYWELRALAYNAYDEPGNVWRLRVRVEMGPPAAPTTFVATPQADNQTVVLTWTGGPERDRAYYTLERQRWDGAVWPGLWTTLASNLDAKASTYTDSGSVGSQLDPWGDGLNPNRYQYRLWAVDSCNPGLAGPAALAEAVIPDAASTTTTLASTTTTAPTTTTSTSTTTTTLASYSVMIKNNTNKTYSINIKNGGGTTVYSGSVGKNATITVSSLTAGNFLITATSSGRPTLTQSFSLPAQNGQIVMTIL